MGRKKNLPLLENIEIIDIAAEGKAIARVNEMVLFVPQVIPGDIVDVQVRKKKRHYMEGVAVKFHQYSNKRTEPFCEHFGDCGGCKWQHLQYENQLFYKQKQVVDNLTRIGKVSLPPITPICGADKIKFYRNKLEYTFSNKSWIRKDDFAADGSIPMESGLGFHISGLFDKVLDVKNCYLQPEPSNSIRLAVKKYSVENNISYFDIRAQQGMLRNLIIRTSSTGEVMVIISFYFEDVAVREGLLQHLADTFPQITSLMYVINSKGNDTILDQDIIVFKGRDYILEKMEDLSFKIGPKSFYQTNSEQAYQLYKITRDFAALTGNELVYDLYTGTGTIANFIAKFARKVIGIEYVAEAIQDAYENSKLNHIDNTLFYAGNMKEILTQSFIDTHGKADVIIADPPRAGMDVEVIDALLYCSPQKIVYVSCNPATQARDLQLLNEHYHVTRVQPVDMFPHTHHVENVVLLEKNHI